MCGCLVVCVCVWKATDKVTRNLAAVGDNERRVCDKLAGWLGQKNDKKKHLEYLPR